MKRGYNLAMGGLTEEQQELRDRFAIAALTALLNNLAKGRSFAAQPDRQREDTEREKLAAEAYRWADAMLKMRDQ